MRMTGLGGNRTLASRPEADAQHLTQVSRSMVETRIPEAAIDGAPPYGQGLYLDQPEDRLLPSGTFASAAPDRT